MKTLNATLLAAQKTMAGNPIASAAYADNQRLHLQLFDDSGVAGNFIAACVHGAAFVRIRKNGANLEFQKITDPTTLAEWSSWTAFAYTNVSNQIAIFSTGTFAVAVWQDSADLDIKYSRSADGLTSWSAPAVAYALASAAALGAVGNDATHAGIFYWNVSDIYWGLYDPAADTWAAASAAGLTLLIYSYVTGAWDNANSRWIIAITANGYATGSYTPIAFLTRSAAGAWSTPRVWYLGATNNTTDHGGLRMSQSKINGFWWLSFWRFKWWTATNYYYLACSDDGEYWEDLTGIDARTAAGVSQNHLQVLDTLAGYVWAADDRWIFRSAAQVFVDTSTVRAYRMDNDANGGRLYLELKVTYPTQTDPTLFSVLTLNRGLAIAGVNYNVSAGTWYVTAFTYDLQDNVLAIEAIDALGLLADWRADQSFRWASERIDTLVTLVCALAGIHSVTFDAATVWADTIPLFSINPDSGGLDALRSLAARAAFDVRINEDGSLYCYVPTASPASQYTYGAANHVLWPGHFGRRAAPTHLTVLADTPSHSAESRDFATESSNGRRLSSFTYQRAISAAADSAELTAARLVVAQENGRHYDFEAPPNLALELADVIDFADTGWANANGPWRAAAFSEFYNTPGKAKKFHQHVFVRGTA